MPTRNIACVGTFLPKQLRDDQDWSAYSPAGQAKQQSIISALSRSGSEVDAVSSVIPFREGVGRVSKRVTEDEHAQVHVPPGIDLIPDSESKFLMTLLRTIQFKFVLPLFVTLYLCVLAQRREYDAIVFYNFNIITAFPAQIAGALFRTPLIIDFNDSRLDSQDRFDRLKDRIYLYVIDPWLSGGICINTNMTSVLRTDNTVVVRGEPSVEMSDDTELESNTDSTLTVFYGGKLDDVRGINTLLSAAPEIVTGRDVEIRITGYGPKVEEVKQRVSEIDTDSISFLGFLSSEEYRQELIGADIAVNLQRPDAPGNEYTFPTKILDYLATGNIVISTRMSDLEAVLDDILVFTEPTSDDATVTIGEVCDDFTNHSERITAGYAWVQENCSSEKRIQAISKVLDKSCS